MLARPDPDHAGGATLASPPPPTVTIIGGGLAGTEAALTLAAAGVSVRLCEMRPGLMTPAHETGGLAELVCSNSLKSDLPDSATGMLKAELRALGSPLLAAADACRVPAGRALAVDRVRFSDRLTQQVEAHPLIRVERGEVTSLPRDGLVVLAPGPLASTALMSDLETLVGKERLFFFDAIAPVVDAESLDMGRLFAASRYEDGEGDYLNAGMDQPTYIRFVKELLAGEKLVPHGFDAEDRLPLFSGCEPIEAIASRGWLSLAHGPMRPTGLKLHAPGPKLFAVVQLRAENVERTAFNLVGFQTRLVQAEQKRIFRLIPGLQNARFLRYGSLHRNSYLDSPRLLGPDLSLNALCSVTVAGQFAGAEGYVESIALGALAARFTRARLAGAAPGLPPPECALGALLRYVTTCPSVPMQPSNMHFGLFPPVPPPGGTKRERVVERAREAFAAYLAGPGPGGAEERP
jgi:methylenetetrahydrofolate--tRNA-(uracil-5-)-methyltransferase